MAKIYIAARFSRRAEAHELSKRLRERGHSITSRWVRPNDDHVLPTGISAQAADAERTRFALEDCADVIDCDCMVSLMEEPRSNGRGGRHVEFGMALGLRKRLVIIGEAFHEAYGDDPATLEEITLIVDRVRDDVQPEAE